MWRVHPGASSLCSWREAGIQKACDTTENEMMQGKPGDCQTLINPKDSWVHVIPAQVSAKNGNKPHGTWEWTTCLKLWTLPSTKTASAPPLHHTLTSHLGEETCKGWKTEISKSGYFSLEAELYLKSIQQTKIKNNLDIQLISLRISKSLLKRKTTLVKTKIKELYVLCPSRCVRS